MMELLQLMTLMLDSVETVMITGHLMVAVLVVVMVAVLVLLTVMLTTEEMKVAMGIGMMLQAVPMVLG